MQKSPPRSPGRAFRCTEPTRGIEPLTFCLQASSRSSTGVHRCQKRLLNDLFGLIGFHRRTPASRGVVSNSVSKIAQASAVPRRLLVLTPGGHASR